MIAAMVDTVLGTSVLGFVAGYLAALLAERGPKFGGRR